MCEEYTKMFEGLLGRLTRLTLKKVLENELNRILDEIIEDIIVIWAYFKKKNYLISEEERKSFYCKIEKHHNKLDELVEKHEILKRCSNCNEKLPISTNYFYLDRSRRGGLSVVCKICHRTIQRENYRRKKKTNW